MPGKLSEKILLYKVLTKHDPEAYAGLYDAYVERIYRFIYFKVASHEEAEDLTSEVFLKTWHYLQENKEIKSFSGLLYKVARNAIVDLYRAKSAKPESLMTEEMDVSDSGKWEDKTLTKLEVDALVVHIKKLKQEYQEVIMFRYIDELEIEEIAEITGKRKVAVRVTLHRALKRLKELSEPNDIK